MNAGKLDAFEHAVETLVGAAGRGPKAIEGIEGGGGSGLEERGGRKPGRFHLDLELASRVLQRIVGGVMGAEFGIEVAENTDAEGFAHKRYSKLAVHTWR